MPTFLTEKRRKVLNGSYDGSEAALRNQESRLRKSASQALDELVAVAQSPEIDNNETFDADQIYALLVTLTMEEYTGPGNPEDREIDDGFKLRMLEAVRDFEGTYHGTHGHDADSLD